MIFGQISLRVFVNQTPGQQIRDPEWPMKPKYLSPCYTTRWEEILTVG
ncbi:DUF4113 domain-containing protein [Spirosoma panaciterrae]|nr:DUF4113 domain-containing protein [Spirosoma panaciterrae]